MKSEQRRNMHIVNGSRNMAGVITANQTFTSARPDITPNKIAFFLKRDNIKTAKDVMVEPDMVMPDDDPEDASRAARIFKLHGIPVCRNGKLAGELDAFKLVYGLMKSKKQ